MPYKEMYLTMAKATERAIRILTEVQVLAEEQCLSAEEPKLIVLPTSTQDD